MRDVLELQALKVEGTTKPASIFSTISAFGCIWTTLMPMSSASIAVC
ncbi:class III lanthipeptide [Actinotignum sp. GS-2025b]|nr:MULTISPECIES: class III lanthipeptide [unclassified Pauljensenia]MDK6400308.1 class III lanthipeptide [Pauljensenia sp. UMB9872]MDK7172809.1 class III lanthipeptide [Pauljensenia sp. UMB1235]